MPPSSAPDHPPAWTGFFRTVGAIVWKDLAAEFRSKEMLNAMVVFSLLVIAAADTYRAAATEQLMIWAQRAGAEFVKHKDNADPAAVAFDAVAAASARGCDVVFIDTAGRLHT